MAPVATSMDKKISPRKFDSPEQLQAALQQAAVKTKKKIASLRRAAIRNLAFNSKSRMRPDTMASLYSDIDRFLCEYEDITFLSDMPCQRWLTTPLDAWDDDMLAQSALQNRVRGLQSLKKIVEVLLSGVVEPERRAEIFIQVVQAYDAEWDRYKRDKMIGLVRPGTEDYCKYSWRGNGPKPYFEGLIYTFLNKKPKRYRSIDEPSELG